MIKIQPHSFEETPVNSPARPIPLFSIPIYEKYYGNHETFKQSVSEYLFDDNNYQRNTSRETLKFTHPNLHKEPAFQPFVEFLKEGIAEAFTDLGYVPSFNITGIWATRHIAGGYHHRHVHNNSFIAGVYYFNGIEGKTPGTTFYSDWKPNLIKPAMLTPPRLKLSYSHTSFFEEGKLIIFPAWLEHNTPPNVPGSDRIILSFNCMPVGKTNNDPFDRYNYQSIENAEMISYNDEKFT